MSGPCRLEHDWFPEPLPANIELGEGSWLYSSFAFLHCRSVEPLVVRVGRSSGVYHGSFFELGPHGAVTIGDFSALVGVIVATNGRVAIGNYCFIAHEVVIADTFASRPWPAAGSADHDAARTLPEPCVSLGDNVWVGAGAVLLRGAHLGAGAIVGAGTVVDFAVPAYAIVAGNPARIVGHAPQRDAPQVG